MTLLELTTVVLVLLILGVLLLPVYAGVLRRTEKTSCISNLHALHVGVDMYIQDHHVWPQIKTKGVEPQDVATSWINALQPYGLAQKNWLCPTVQKNLGNPDMTDHENARVDYAAMTFDSNPRTPFRWSLMPWFAETVDAHGNGQLLIFPDGHVQELGDFKAMLKKSPAPAPAPH